MAKQSHANEVTTFDEFQHWPNGVHLLRRKALQEMYATKALLTKVQDEFADTLGLKEVLREVLTDVTGNKAFTPEEIKHVRNVGVGKMLIINSGAEERRDQTIKDHFSVHSPDEYTMTTEHLKEVDIALESIYTRREYQHQLYESSLDPSILSDAKAFFEQLPATFTSSSHFRDVNIANQVQYKLIKDLFELDIATKHIAMIVFIWVRGERPPPA